MGCFSSKSAMRTTEHEVPSGVKPRASSSEQPQEPPMTEIASLASQSTVTPSRRPTFDGSRSGAPPTNRHTVVYSGPDVHARSSRSSITLERRKSSASEKGNIRGNPDGMSPNGQRARATRPRSEIMERRRSNTSIRAPGTEGTPPVPPVPPMPSDIGSRSRPSSVWAPPERPASLHRKRSRRDSARRPRRGDTELRDYSDVLDNFKVVNRGGYCAIYRCTVKGENADVAVKVLEIGSATSLRDSGVTARVQRRLEREKNIWKTLDHKNVLRLLGIASVQGKPALVSPFCPNGNASEYLAYNPNADRATIILQLADAVSYLHSRQTPVIHGDLKPTNILIDEYGDAQLADFGTTRPRGQEPTMFQTSRTIENTIAYAAPETLDGATPSTECDVFSFAWVVLELLTNKQPYYWANSIHALYGFILSNTMPTHQHYPSVKEFSPVWEVIIDCLYKDPGSRLTIFEARERLLDMTDKLREASVSSNSIDSD